MKNYEKKIAEAIRIEHEEKTGRLFIVFEVTDEQYKQDIKKTWTQNIEYKIIDKNLISNEE